MNRLETITPSALFDELFPPASIFFPRSTMQAIKWVHDDKSRLDTLTGITLGVMGKMPLVCHKNVATPEILDFFRASGLLPAENIATFETEIESASIAARYAEDGMTIAYVYPPPDTPNCGPSLLIPLSLYGWLNDKANLCQLVEREYLSASHILTVRDLSIAAGILCGRPVYIKACVPGASGAGRDIFYCPDNSSRLNALNCLLPELDMLSGILIEEAIDIATCWCLSLAVLDSGIRYLGAAEQLFSSPGKQCGSRIDNSNLPPQQLIDIAVAVAERAREKGFLGIAGFDIGISRDFKPYVFDLNFRIASSTPQVLLHESATTRVNCSISETCNFSIKGGLSAALNEIRAFASRGEFVPVRLFEGNASSNWNSIISGLVVGSSKDHAAAVIASMTDKLNNLLA